MRERRCPVPRSWRPTAEFGSVCGQRRGDRKKDEADRVMALGVKALVLLMGAWGMATMWKAVKRVSPRRRPLFRPAFASPCAHGAELLIKEDRMGVFFLLPVRTRRSSTSVKIPLSLIDKADRMV